MTRRLPLAGVRVFDLTHAWSGPMSTRVLAMLGAEVIKIENRARPDMLRGTGNDLLLRYPNQDYGTDRINRNAWFNTQSVGKLSVQLDLKDEDDKARAMELAASCDVVVSNYRAGVLSRMGFDYAHLSEINPRIVVVEMTAFPSTSRHAKAAGFGAQFDAASGNTWLSGDEHGPVLTGFAIGDPVGGLFATSAVVAALERRRVTGRGVHVEVPQTEAMMSLFGEQFLLESRGVDASQRLNGHPTGAPHGIHRAGDDRWIAVGVHTDEQYQALIDTLVDGRDLQRDGWATAVGRRADLEAVETALASALTKEDDAAALARRLQAAGVPAGIVAGPAELAADEQLWAVGFFTELDHPAAGRHPYPGLPVRIDGEPLVPAGPAPLLGEHTERVLGRRSDLADGQPEAPNADVELVL